MKNYATKVRKSSHRASHAIGRGATSIVTEGDIPDNIKDMLNKFGL